jgi:hypothetical protein
MNRLERGSLGSSSGRIAAQKIELQGCRLLTVRDRPVHTSPDQSILSAWWFRGNRQIRDVAVGKLKVETTLPIT